MGRLLVGLCYRPPGQDDDTHELFFKELRETSRSAALLLMGDFNLLDVNYECHKAGDKQAHEILEAP